MDARTLSIVTREARTLAAQRLAIELQQQVIKMPEAPAARLKAMQKRWDMLVAEETAALLAPYEQAEAAGNSTADPFA